MKTANRAKKLTATNFDLPSLHLLRQEIEVTLSDAEAHLSEFNDDTSQAPLLLDSVETLTQVCKVLRLISLEEGAVLAYALAQSLQKLYDARNDDDNELVMDISEGIMTLGRYIEFVLLKETIEPSLILPIINKLKQRLGEAPLTLEQLTNTKYSSLVIANPEQNFQSLQELGITSKTLVEAYRAGLSVALSAKAPVTNPSELQKLKAMQSACEVISKHSDSLFWESADAAVSDLATALPLTNTQKRALIFVEQQFNDYLPINDARFADLVRFASSRDSDIAKKVQQRFSGNSLDTEQLAGMKRFLFGPDREATVTLNNIIQEEIDMVKTASDNYARQDNIASSDTEIQTMIEHMDTLSLVFKTLDLDDASNTLRQQIEQVKGWSQPTPQDFDKLLESLMVAENAAIYLAKSHTPGASTLPLYNKHISLHQLDTAYTTLIKESRMAAANIENAFNEYSNDPNRDVMNLINVPEMMRNISGACRFLNLPRSSQLLKRASSYMDMLVQNGSQGISPEQLAKIADVVTAADYYLESLEVHKPAGHHAIKVGQKSLQNLMVA
ncbi:MULTISPECIES: hypothetical protein [unclassified Moraxella]|uniref:hypothetical protein n=1 Tax=unclassified Moraxella TaxID=2685852 RepID=UPI003AF9F1AD